MAYFTRQQVSGRIDEPTLILLTNDNPNGATVNESVITEVTNDITGIMDGALRGRVPLPIENPDTDLTDLALVLFRYKLYERRQYLGMSESLIAGYTQAMARLREYQTGKRILNIGTAETRPSFIKVISKERVFTSEILGKYAR